ncbi:MAG TPA: MBL fold metallo-hydrolase, partial [Phycisphaerae bacterium]|nr:MBL fold metallo-hydrolase [Phycisphaerae bacterium]
MMTKDPADTPKIIKVAEGFYVRQEVDNIAWMDLGGCAVVVDALEQANLEGEVFEAIASTLGETPVRYVLNTHTHYDHVALNQAFRRRYGSEIVNLATTKIPPEGRWFEGPRRRAQMIPMPGCHTAEDCIVWVPSDKALFVGDIFGWGVINLTAPLTDKTAGLVLETHQKLIDFEAAVVIPGHGPLATTADLKRWVKYFRWLIDEARRAVADGASDAEIARRLAPPEDMAGWWRFVEWKHADSVSKVLAAVRRG